MALSASISATVTTTAIFTLLFLYTAYYLHHFFSPRLICTLIPGTYPPSRELEKMFCNHVNLWFGYEWVVEILCSSLTMRYQSRWFGNGTKCVSCWSCLSCCWILYFKNPCQKFCAVMLCLIRCLFCSPSPLSDTSVLHHPALQPQPDRWAPRILHEMDSG
jgi:hypothetical protein